MRKSLIIAALLLSAPAWAQVPPPDPQQLSAQLAVSQQLLGEANGRVTSALAQVQVLEARVKTLTEELAKATAPKDAPPRAPGPPEKK